MVHEIDGVQICIFCEDGVRPEERTRRHGIAKVPNKMAEDTMSDTTSGEGVCGCGRPLPHKGRCAARRVNGSVGSVGRRRAMAKVSTRVSTSDGEEPKIRISLTESSVNSLIDRILASFSLERRIELLESMLAMNA